MNNKSYDMADGRSIHQEMMDAAYERWNGGDLDGLPYEDFLDSLDPLDEMAVLIGNCNQQVENGGWAQWVYNGYCADGGADLIGYIRFKLEHCPLAGTVRKMVSRVVMHAESVDHEDDSLDYGYLDSLDDEYYAINAAWMIQVEIALRRLKGEDIPQGVLDHHADQLKAGREGVLSDLGVPSDRPRA